MREQMQDMLKRMEERDAATPENRNRDIELLNQIAKDAAETLTPYGDFLTAQQAFKDFKQGDYVSGTLGAAATAVGLVPGIGDVAAKGFKKTRKAYKLFVKGEDGELYPLFVNANTPVKQGEFLEADFPDIAFKGKRKEGSKEIYYVPTKGAKRSKGEKSKNTGDPIIIPDEETRKKLIEKGFITERTKRTKEAPFGKVTAVAARPGWHASQSPVATHLGPQDLKIDKNEAEKLIAAGIAPEAIKRRGDQFYVKRRAEDQVFAEVEMADDVDYQSMLAKEGRSDINDYVPKGGSYKYSDGQADSDQWVVGGDMKVNRVLSREETKNLQKEMGVVDLPYRDEVEAILERKFLKGGVVMDDYLIGKMMNEESPQKFAEGGLNHEGGTTDPVSGNDVPIGSMQKEVRDDIPAQLSEGEYVIPADVVRFFGVKFFEELRMKAKDGMKLLQAKGQMGNGDEQYVDDDVPFDMEDLDLDFNEGGVVPSPYQYTKKDVGEASKYMAGIKTADQSALDMYDINKDGKIDVSDTVGISKRMQEQEDARKKASVDALKISAGITKDPSQEQITKLDTNYDGKIDIQDVTGNLKGKSDEISNDPVDPVDDQTKQIFKPLPIADTPAQKQKPESTYSFDELMGSYMPKPFSRQTGTTTPKEDETPVDDRTEETDIGGQGSEGGASDTTEGMTPQEIAEANYESHLQTMQAVPQFASFIGSKLPGLAGKAAAVLGVVSDAHTLAQQSQLAGLNVSFTDALQTSLGNLMESFGLSTNPDGLTSMAQEIEAAYGMQDISGPVTTPTMGYYNPALNPFAPIPEGEPNAGMPQGGYSSVTGHYADPVTGAMSATGTQAAFEALIEEDPAYALAVIDARNKNPFTPKFAQVSPALQKKAKEAYARQEAAKDAAQSTSTSTGINVEPEQVEGVMKDNPGMTAQQAAQAVVDAISAEAAMTGNDPNAPSPSTDAIGGYGDEGLDTPDPSTDAIGGYGDEGLDSPDSDPEAESDPDPDDENKGGFITKRKPSGELKPKFKKRKGLASRK